MFKKTKGKTVIFVFILSIVFNHAFAQFEINKYSVNNGGGKMIGGLYEMRTSIGQVDASHPQSGGSFSVNGGLWQENSDLIFINRFE